MTVFMQSQEHNTVLQGQGINFKTFKLIGKPEMRPMESSCYTNSNTESEEVSPEPP